MIHIQFLYPNSPNGFSLDDIKLVYLWSNDPGVKKVADSFRYSFNVN
jgi:hypothetical protein